MPPEEGGGFEESAEGNERMGANGRENTMKHVEKDCIWLISMLDIGGYACSAYIYREMLWAQSSNHSPLTIRSLNESGQKLKALRVL